MKKLSKRKLLTMVVAFLSSFALSAAHRWQVGKAYAKGFAEGAQRTSEYVARNFLCFQLGDDEPPK